MDINSTDLNKIASPYSRIASLFIDFILLQLIFIPLYIGTWILFNNLPGSSFNFGPLIGLILILFIFIGSFITFCIYTSVFQSRYGQTFGMKFLGIKIINEYGANPEIGKAFIRNAVITLIPWVLTLAPLGFGIIITPIYLLIITIYLVFKNKNTPHLLDKWFKTQVVVVNDKKVLSISITVIYILFILIYLASVASYVIDQELRSDKFQKDKYNNDSSTVNQPQKQPQIENNSRPNNNVTHQKYSGFYDECMKTPDEYFTDKVKFCRCVADQNPTNINIDILVSRCSEFVENKFKTIQTN
jgi:uncharacterized RDD family membrane protein YckC